jgi:arsenate reductase
MNEYIIYHNPRCSKSRQTLQLLRDAGIEPTIVEYLKTPLVKGQLRNISQLLGLRPKDFVRKIENDFKNNDCQDF